ncbi:MAG: sigma-54 dependent transcriptional regulator [Anaerosporomusa subterranea]|jgi:PAS domain S-box-containing protein|nr:sigma-54 dependent transcriptional regulator [Anaerosporomusa subterranea]
MSRIAFIAPDKQLYLQGKSIIEELGLSAEVDIYLARMDKAIALARRLENADVDVIVSRGGTAQVIQQSQVNIPIVEIPITAQDLAQLFQEAKLVTGMPRPKVLISVFHNWLKDSKVLADIMDIELTPYPLQSLADIPFVLAQISQLRPTDFDIVVGGKRTVIAAAQLGFKTLLIRTGSLALKTAFLDAQKVALGRKIEKEQAQRFTALVQYSSDGIISVDQDKIIKVFNPRAEHLLNCTSKDMIGQKIDSCLHFINIDACLTKGQESIGHTVCRDSIWLSFNIAPIIVDEIITGAIITFQDITRIQEMEARIRNEVLGKKFIAKYTLNDITGTSQQIIESKRIAREMAAVEATVLISGESGTGKELFAQSIHNESRRKSGPFVALNCAALSPNLIESELFGYVEGAFTGATKKGKPGLFEMAHRGTIFLDEISEMDKYGQSRLLRVLQEKQIMRLGDDKNIPVDVRIIAATNRNLSALINEGQFRQDLFYRLKVLTLKLPPLRSRAGDIKLLSQYFVRRYNQQHGKRLEFTADAYEYLTQYAWPGNIRELMYFIERLIVIANEKIATPEVIKKYWEDRDDEISPALPAKAAIISPLNSEKERILATLAECRQNKTRAAELLGMDRTTLYRKLKNYGIHSKEIR